MFNGKGQWILKNYHQNPRDLRDRLVTEFRFLSFLYEHKIPCVPKPIGMDSQKQCALYSFLPGERPEKITERHIRLAASFIREINKYGHEESAKKLSCASDSCFSVHDHLDLVNRKIIRLAQVEPILDIEHDASSFVREKLIPEWKNVKKRVTDAMSSTEINAPINRTSWILSPSDFGFHNMLEYREELYFIDFEYAGWDDPVKLSCDFACQPDISVDKEAAIQFTSEFIREIPEAESIIRRVTFLLPAHRLKWCCILLNEFLPGDRQRRLYAGKEDRDLLPGQLKKAKKYFSNHII